MSGRRTHALFGGGRTTLILSILLLLTGFGFVLAGSSQAEVKAKLAEVGSPPGSGAGQLSTPQGIAMSLNGAGEADAGDFYVADRGNHRVAQFSAGGAFIRAFGLDVVSTGPDNVTPTNAVQSVNVPASVSAGIFTLSFNGQSTGGSGTGNLVEGSNVITSLISARGIGNLAVDSPIVSNVVTATGKFIVGQPISGAGIPAGTTIINVAAATLTLSANATASGVGLALSSIGPRPFAIGQIISGAGIPAATTITAVSAAEGKLTLSASVEAGFTSSEVALKSGLAFNSTSAQVQTALQGLSSIGTGNATATGGPGGTLPYSVTFAGALKELPVPLLVADSANLTGGSVAVSMTILGQSAYEICKAAVPADICKIGLGNATPGSINNPMAVAVDPSTGNVYVTGNPNKRIDVFSAGGTFQGAFGLGVRQGDSAPFGLDFCTASTGCLAGQSSGAAGAMATSAASRTLTADSSGNLYVPNPGNRRIDVFLPSLNESEVTGVSFVRGIGWDVIPSGKPGDVGFGAEVCTVASTCQAGVAGGGAGQFGSESPNSVAVDSSGNIYVVTFKGTAANCEGTPCRLQKFNPDGSIANASFGPASGPCQTTYTSGAPNEQEVRAVAVDQSNQHVFVLKKTSATGARICEFDSAGVFDGVSISPLTNLTVESAVGPGLAVGTAGRVYAAQRAPGVYILGPVPPPEVEILPVTNVTKDSAKLHGEVTVPAPGGEGFDTKYHFEYSSNGVDWIPAPIPDATVGSVAGTFPVELTITGLDPSTPYSARLVASTSTSVTSDHVSLKTLAEGPTIVSIFSEGVTQTEAVLGARINPRHLDTTYHFEWATQKEWEETGEYGNDAPAFERGIGSGTSPMVVKETVTGLQERGFYHFRVIAKNSAGSTTGPDQELETLNSCGLPDGRCFELVSPADKGPAGSAGKYLEFGAELQFQAAPEGGSLAYTMANGLPDATAGEDVLYLVRRETGGWRSEQIEPPVLAPSQLIGEGGFFGLTKGLADNLSCGVVVNPSPLTADAPAQTTDGGGANLYRRDNLTGAYTVISNLPAVNASSITQPLNDPGYRLVGMSPDCNRVIYQSQYRYPGIAGEGITRLYEWDHGTLRNVGVIPAPGGPEAVEALPGADSGSYVKAVSSDGARVLFTSKSRVGGDLGKQAIFLREDAQTARDISQSETGTANNDDSRYQIASGDGSRIFFTARYGVATGPSSSGVTSCSSDPVGGAAGNGTGCDLYEYDLEAQAGERLTDLTPHAAEPKGAGVVGVLAASVEGDYVYFAARGQLVAGKGRTAVENEASGSYNVYLAHHGGTTRTTHFVGLLNGSDASPSDSRALISSLPRWSSNSTPDGKHLVFESTANVTGYDSGGAKMVYRYSAETDSTACVSCRHDGKLAAATGSFQPLLTATRTTVTADGSRVFFYSRDALAYGGIEGRRNLYEWVHGQVFLLLAEPEGLSEFFELFLADASEDGKDIYFATPAKLVDEDFDGRADVYDARVGGGFPAEPVLPSCDPLAESACLGGPSSSQPGVTMPLSSTSLAPGNPPAEKPSAKKKKKKQKHSKRKSKNQTRKSQARDTNINRRAGK